VAAKKEGTKFIEKTRATPKSKAKLPRDI